jgi:hypothetical protein
MHKGFADLSLTTWVRRPTFPAYYTHGKRHRKTGGSRTRSAEYFRILPRAKLYNVGDLTQVVSKVFD